MIADFNLAVVNADHQTAKYSGFTVHSNNNVKMVMTRVHNTLGNDNIIILLLASCPGSQILYKICVREKVRKERESGNKANYTCTLKLNAHMEGCWDIKVTLAWKGKSEIIHAVSILSQNSFVKQFGYRLIHT